jgi:hypothetical protein
MQRLRLHRFWFATVRQPSTLNYQLRRNIWSWNGEGSTRPKYRPSKLQYFIHLQLMTFSTWSKTQPICTLRTCHAILPNPRSVKCCLRMAWWLGKFLVQLSHIIEYFLVLAFFGIRMEQVAALVLREWRLNSVATRLFLATMEKNWKRMAIPWWSNLLTAELVVLSTLLAPVVNPRQIRWVLACWIQLISTSDKCLFQLAIGSNRRSIRLFYNGLQWSILFFTNQRRFALVYVLG